MSHGSRMLSADLVIADIAQVLGPSASKGQGYYTSYIQRALAGIGYLTLYDKRDFTATIPDDLVIDLPPDLANVERVHGFSGTLCEMTASNKIWITSMKRFGPSGVIKENRGFADKVQKGTIDDMRDYLFCNVQQGKLMVSSACKQQFEKVYVEYSGTGVVFGEEPTIPMVLREYVVNQVLVWVLPTMLSQDRAMYGDLLRIYEGRLNASGNVVGSTMFARMQANKIDRAKLNDLRTTLDYYGEGQQ